MNRSGSITHVHDLAASPVHVPGHSLRWTTANVDEGLPGIVTPLTWSLYFPPTEQTMRDCWVDLGVLPRSQRAVPEDVDQRFLSVAFGHAIANVDQMGLMAARIPGGSAAMMEEQLFGSVQGGGLPEPRGWAKVRRYPFVAAKFPRALRRAVRSFGPISEETETWWLLKAFGMSEASLEEAVATLVEARTMFERGLTVHMVLSMAAQGLMGQVESIAARAGIEGLSSELIKSDEGTAELDLVRDLWRLSRDEIDVEAFVRAHGYHGPREGLVDSVVWREDSTSLVDLARRYRDRAGGEDVETMLLRRRTEHAAAVARLEAGLGPVRRRIARKVVGFASNVPVWRETGRANILRGVDVTRAASRVVGSRLVERGVLDIADDVSFLTIDEISSADHASYRELVAQRRTDHAAYESMTLPHVWSGLPEVTMHAVDPQASGARRIEGLGVSAGIAEGIVRVVTDLDDADLDDGAIMVCKVTDPSWASLFPLVEAVVTDVGSAVSHAAIVCRELGLPCVANTRTGTRDLVDGMRVRVDGTAGVVEVLDASLNIN